MVLSIIVTLATVLIVIIDPKFQIQRANDGKRKADLKQIQSGLEIYRADKGGYPKDTAADGSLHAVQNSGTSLLDLSSPTTIYIQRVPKDPVTGSDYFYCTEGACGGEINCGTGTECVGYAIFACLENNRDTSTENYPLQPAGMAVCPSGKYYRVLNP